MGENHSLYRHKIRTDVIIRRPELKGICNLLVRANCMLEAVINNFREFKNYYNHLNKNLLKHKGMTLLFTDNTSLDKSRKEFVATMINFIVSTRILTEYTRNSMGEYKNEGVSGLKEFNQKLVNENFTYDPLSQFIESLRNYITHVGHIPIDIVTINIHDSPEYFSDTYPNYDIVFDDKRLLESNDFKKYAKDHIEDMKHYHNVYNDLHNYLIKIINHQNSLFDFLVEKYFRDYAV